MRQFDPEVEEVLRLRHENGIGLQRAKRRLQLRNLELMIEEAKSAEEIKEVLKGIVKLLPGEGFG